MHVVSLRLEILNSLKGKISPSSLSVCVSQNLGHSGSITNFSKGKFLTSLPAVYICICPAFGHDSPTPVFCQVTTSESFHVTTSPIVSVRDNLNLTAKIYESLLFKFQNLLLTRLQSLLQRHLTELPVVAKTHLQNYIFHNF